MSSSPKTPFQQVAEFQQQVLHVPSLAYPHFLLPEAEAHNLNCLAEEMTELIEAAYERDMASMADALADLIYFAYGMAYKMGLPFDSIWNLVHSANMSKVKGMTKRGVETDAAKPEGWSDPKIAIKELLK